MQRYKPKTASLLKITGGNIGLNANSGNGVTRAKVPLCQTLDKEP